MRRSLPLQLVGTAAFAAAAVCVGQPRDDGLARRVGRAVVRDSVFAFAEVPWRPTQGVQVWEPDALQDGETAWARIELEAEQAGEFRLGLAGAGEATVWIADREIARPTFVPASRPREYAYDHFRWPQVHRVALPAGKHELRVRLKAPGNAPRAFLQFTTEAGAMETRVRFTSDWSEARAPAGAPPAAGWVPVVRPPVRDFVVKADAAFRRHSLVEWHYANGVTHLALLEAADRGAPDLRAHVDRFVSFTLEQLPALRRQYFDQHAWRGANYRLFRAALLDDTSAPALPLLELARRGEGAAAAPLLEEVLRFVQHEHPRLADGTFARDEPEPATVWADDLFMSVAFLARAAQWQGKAALWDEVGRQMDGFHRHLFDPGTGLYWHGFYARRGQPAAFRWARANGWMAWAKAEALRFLPREHPARADIAARHRAHLAAVVQRQAASGRWHQVLDEPTTFEETSATAMFLLAMVRGMQGGWLERGAFAGPAQRAWDGLRERIGADGIVRGITGGTAIGDRLEHYARRPTPDHDPRGVGAVIIAALLAEDFFAHGPSAP
jgi:unsaturated rhamnogalacturonyl hydrolase